MQRVETAIAGVSWRRFAHAFAGTCFSSLHGYRRAFALSDLVAAATLLAIAVPEQLATSRLAGMPPITGYLAFIAGSVCIAVLGHNAQLSVGADSTIAPLFAAGLTRVAPVGALRYEEAVGILALLVGVLVAATGLLRLGWIAEFMSIPIITGFLAGVALIIAIHQLPDLFGLPASQGNDLQRVAAIVRDLPKLHPAALGIGLGVLVVIIACERIDRRIPGALLALIGATLSVHLAGLAHGSISVLGTVSDVVPRLGFRGLSWRLVVRIAPLSAVVALVVLSQTAITTRAFPGRARSLVDVNRDFLATGVGSVLAGCMGSFAVDASPPRTAASVKAGGRTQLTGLIAAGALAGLIPFARVLADVPLAALAAVLLWVAARLFHFGDLVRIARFSRFEIFLASVTLLTSVLVGVEQGIGLAVGLAIVERARLSARPQLHVLGRLPGTTSWVPVQNVRTTEQVPGVLVTLFAAPLWYANVGNFQTEVSAALASSGDSIGWVVLDAIGMSDIDFTGCRAIADLLDRLSSEQIHFAMARVGERVLESLERFGILARIGNDRIYPSVERAVDAVR